MKGKILQLFSLHPGEEKMAFHFSLVAFLWASGTFCALTIADGLFLEKVGAHILPYYYLSSAAIMPLFACLLLYCLNFFRVDQIFLGILCFACFMYLACCLALLNPTILSSVSFFYAFKLFATLLCSLTLSSFWSFIDEFYDMQKAKRVFCLFNSMVYFGDAFGGLLVFVVLPRLGLSFLLGFIACIMLASVVSIHRLKSLYPRVVDDRKDEHVAEKNTFSSFFATLLTSPFALAFVGLTLLTYFICSVTEFNYQSLFERAFKENGVVNSHELTIFMGRISFFVSLANMVFGLTCYSRIVRKMGVNNLAPITSIMFILLFTSWHFVESLVIGVIGFAIVEGVVYAIDDNNFNLLLNAVPTKIKYAVRIFLDSFVEHLGLALGGAFLLFIAPKYYLFLGLLLSFICLFTVLILKSAYPMAIYQNLVDTAIYFEQTVHSFFFGLDPIKKQALQKKLLGHIRSSNPCFFSLDMLLKFEDPSILSPLIRRAEFLSLYNKSRLLKLFRKSIFHKHPQWIACLHKWLHTYSEISFKQKLYFYLAQAGALKKSLASQLLQDSSFSHQISGAVALLQSQDLSQEEKQRATTCIQRGLETENTDHNRLSLQALTVVFEDRYLPYMEHIFNHNNSKNQELLCQLLSRNLCPRHAFLEDLLFSQLKKVSENKSRQYLITALIRLRIPDILLRLIHTAKHFRTREKMHLELNALSLALQIPEKILEIALLPSNSMQARSLALRILKLSHPQIVELNYQELLKTELERAKFYKFKLALLDQFPPQRVYKLQIALASAMQSSKELIVNVLLLDSSMDKVDTFLTSIHAGNEKVRSQALESLEKSCPSAFKEPLEKLFLSPTQGYTQDNIKEFWRLLRLLYNQLKFSPASQDIFICSLIEQQYLFPGMDMPYYYGLTST